MRVVCFFFQAEDGIRDVAVTGVQTCALPILFGFPGFVRVLHPGPPSLFGNAQSSLFCVRAGSSPVPHVGVKGTPSLTVRIRPSSQPSAIHLAGPENDLAVGMSHVPFTTRVRPTLKSESPRSNLNVG